MKQKHCKNCGHRLSNASPMMCNVPMCICDCEKYGHEERDPEAEAIAAAEQRGYAKAVSLITESMQHAEKIWEISVNPDIRNLARERYVTLAEMVGRLTAE